jgi:hypothetical protein
VISSESASYVDVHLNYCAISLTLFQASTKIL